MIQSKVLFSVAEDDKLVELVPKFPCIFDPTNPLYKIQTEKDQAWIDISDYVDRSVEDCKKRWRNIKDTYLKREKKRREPGFSASISVKKWPLANRLLFLGKVEQKSHSNIQTDDTSTQEVFEVDEDTSSSTEPINAPISSERSTSTASKPKRTPNPHLNQNSFQPSNKRQKPNEVSQLMEDKSSKRNEIDPTQSQDDIDLFFKSIAMSVKKLPPELINEAKMKSLQIVFGLESRNTIHSPSQSSSSFRISSSGTNKNRKYQDEVGNVIGLSVMSVNEMVIFAKNVTSQIKLLPISFARPLLQNIQDLVDNKTNGDSFLSDQREISSDLIVVKSEMDIEEYKVEV